MSHFDQAVLLLLALVGIYSPVAAVASYIPLVQPFPAAQQLRLALGLFVNIAGITVVTLLVGEPLLELLGLTPAALSAAGGISLVIAAVPLMIGRSGGTGDAATPAAAPQSWRSIVFMPLTFPLTVGGATIAILVGFRASVDGTAAVAALVVAALVHSAITGICVVASGHVARRSSARAQVILDRVAGILLTAIACILLTSGFTQLVVDVLRGVNLL